MRKFSLLLLVCLITASMAFDYTSYLYPNESANDIVVQNILYGGVSYQLVTIRGVDTFVLRDTQLVNDTLVLNGVIRQKYLSLFYPTLPELQQLQNTVQSYNDSRNFKTQYGKSEEVCRTQLTTSISPGGICLDQNTCTAIAMQICGRYGSGCDAGMFVGPFLDYGKNLKGMDDSMKILFFDLGGISEDNIYANLQEIQSTLNNLKTYDSGIMQSKLRFPLPGDSCPDCIGMCPAPTNNASSINAALNQVQLLLDKTSALGNLDGQANAMLVTSRARISFKEKEHYTALYGARVTSLEAMYPELMANASYAARVSSDPEFTSLYSNYLGLRSEINSKLDAGTYSSIPESIDDLASTLKLLNDSFRNVTGPYDTVASLNQSVAAKNMRAKWQTDPKSLDQVKAYQNLSLRYAMLSSQFIPPLTKEQYASLEKNYTALSSDYDAYLTATSGTISKLPNTLSERLAMPILGAASMFGSLKLGSRESAVKIGMPVLIGLFDLAIISIAVLILLTGIVFLKKHFAKKLVYVVWGVVFLAGVLGAIVLSGGLLVLLGGGAESGTFSSFYASMQASNSTLIRVDTSYLSDPMLTCAQTISSAISAQNKTASIVYDSGTSCTLGNLTINGSSCISGLADEPVVTLKYSTKNSVNYTNVYKQEAILQGDDAYFQECEFAKVIG